MNIVNDVSRYIFNHQNKMHSHLWHPELVAHPEEDVSEAELLVHGEVVRLVPHGLAPLHHGQHGPGHVLHVGEALHLVRHVRRHPDRVLDLGEELDPHLIGPPPATHTHVVQCKRAMFHDVHNG